MSFIHEKKFRFCNAAVKVLHDVIAINDNSPSKYNANYKSPNCSPVIKIDNKKLLPFDLNKNIKNIGSNFYTYLNYNNI